MDNPVTLRTRYLATSLTPTPFSQYVTLPSTALHFRLRLNATEIAFDRYFTLNVSDGLKYYLGRRDVRGDCFWLDSFRTKSRICL